jgi:glutaminyl-peptide cyclotransferase
VAVVAGAQAPAAPVFGYEVVHAYPHDSDAFTQGLLFLDGYFYESTGLNGRSSVRKVRPETGAVVAQRAVDRRYFAEGLTHWRDRLIQLTWETGLGLVYDRASLAPRGTFRYGGEGWGLTQDGRRLIVSDGTANLRFFDPETLRETGHIAVHDVDGPVARLNELEAVDGSVYANVWLTDRIAIIDPGTGRVTGWIDLTGLGPGGPSAGDAVLNGIAWDAAGKRLFVTGKLWPQVFEIRIRRRS